MFIKRKVVRHYHLDHKDVPSVIIHASVLQPILDYVCIALKNQGRIIIGDSQVTEGVFDAAMAASQMDDLLGWYRHQTPNPIDCLDLRINRSVRTRLYGDWGRKNVEVDQRGYHFVDLAGQSYSRDIVPAKLRISTASHKNMYKHHSDGRHECLFPNSALQSDAVISIAKLRTHRRTAISVALKNFKILQDWLRRCLQETHAHGEAPVVVNGDSCPKPPAQRFCEMEGISINGSRCYGKCRAA